MTAIEHLQSTVTASRGRTGHTATLLIRGVEATVERLRDGLLRSWAAAAEIDQALDRRNEDLRQLMSVHATRLP